MNKANQQHDPTSSERLSPLWAMKDPRTFLTSIDMRTINEMSYVCVTILCLFMVFWILIFPSSLWHEHSSTHRTLLRLWFRSMSGHGTSREGHEQQEEVGATTSELITKYSGQYIVQMTHIFPSAIWAAMIPFQLNTKFRKNHRTIHRYVGYGFFVSAILLGIGVFIILYKGLLFENSFPDLPPKPFSAAPALMLLTIYFLGTINIALYYARIANPKNYYIHSIWVIRHVASGIWIALQRILLGSPLFNRPPMTREEQRDAFGNAGFLAIAITTIGGEILIYLWNHEQRSKSATRNVKNL